MVIPADWKEVRLGDIALVVMGQSPQSIYYNIRGDGIPLIQGNADIIDRKSIRRIWTSVSPKVAEPGDVLITVRAPVGYAAIASEQVCLGRGVCTIQPHAADSAFVFHSLVYWELKWKKLEQGSTFTAANSKEVNDFTIHVPDSTKEQEAIAEALSDADAAIESLDALIAKKRDVKQATMQQLLTGRTRLPGFTADWKEVRLGDLGRCLRGVSYKGDSDLSDGDTPTTVRLLRSNNVQNSLIHFNDVQYVNHGCVSDEQILRRNDIVICMANGSKVLVGKTGLYRDSQDTRYTFGAFMGCFRSSSDQAHAIFVRYLFLTKQYQDYISNLLAGSSINNLTPKSIESLLFNVPPLKEQEAIAETLSVMDDELDALTEQVSKLRMVKEGIMQDLLTGKVRLV